MRLNNQILFNLKEDKEDWYYLCNDAEQALFKVKNQCNDERAIKTLEKMIIDLNSIRMEQYETLNEYSLVEEEIYSNLDNMVDALRTNFKGITNLDYIKKSLRFHYDNDYISEEEYKELYKEFVASKKSVVKSYEDLPYSDFKARNTLGTLKDGKNFVIFDDDDVYIIKGSIEELKKIIYSDEDQDLKMFDNFMNKYSKRADNELETQILIDTGRFIDDPLNEQSLIEEDRPLLNKAKEQLDFLNTKLADVNDEVVNKTRKELEDKIASYEKHNKEKSLKEDGFRSYVDKQLRDGAIDDPEYVNTLSDEEYEDLLTNTWMKDPEMIKMYNELNPNAKIYQIRDVANTDYAFRGYDEVADKIDLDDYDLVATIYVSDEDDDALEKIFMYGNTDKSKFTMIKPMRSISVSDIIEYDGAKYYVDDFGFKEL